MKPPYALYAENLWVHAPSRLRKPGPPLLQDAQLCLKTGQWLAITGPNGAGKSTLLKALAGLLSLKKGKILLQGQELHHCPPTVRAQRMAWLPQSHAAWSSSEGLTVGRAVMLGRLPWRQGWLALPSHQDHQIVQQALERMGCSNWWHRPMHTLSGGQKQQVALARILATQAPVVLMDEPLVGLDLPHQADWIRQVRDWCAHGHSIISVLHDLNIALLADEVLIMQAGKTLAQGDARSPRIHSALEAVFDHRIRIHCPANGASSPQVILAEN